MHVVVQASDRVDRGSDEGDTLPGLTPCISRVPAHARPTMLDVSVGAATRPLPEGRPAERDFRAIYDAYFGFVSKTLRRLGVSEADAADHAQVVFLVAHTRLGTFEGRSKLDTWLFGICRRVVWNHRRARLRRPEVPIEPSVLDVSPARRWNPDEAYERYARVEEVLSRLPWSQLQVFVLSEVEELRAPEIAERLGITGSMVKYRLRSARQQLLREVRRLRPA
jgi:RNA polymerase sigma-70 factor (ECF subfamily)